MLQKLDDLLNSITIYRLVTYGLGLLALITIIFSITGALDYSPEDMAGSLLVIMTVGFIANQVMSRLWGVPANAESGLITCFILFFLLPPELSTGKVVVLALATVVAIASKYVLAYRGKHIFNPAAFGVFLVGILGLGHAAWWVGSSSLWVFTLVVGLLVARKTKRLLMVAVFATAAVGTAAVVALNGSVGVYESLELLLFSSPLIFLGTIMLTEPSTMPPRRRQQLVFAVVAGALFTAHPQIGPLFVYPETALLMANLYAFAVSPKRRWTLELRAKHKIADDLYDYEFSSSSPLEVTPGQYMEVTMPVASQDDRGNRRTFTVASSPTEAHVHIGVRIPNKASRFKTTFGALKPGDQVMAGQIAGNFVLPRDGSQKLLLVAGGVGITPYRSMIKYLSDTRQNRDITIVYQAKRAEEFMYKSVFEAAKAAGVKTIYIADPAPLSADQLAEIVPDLHERRAFISGPPVMVRHVKKVLHSLGVPRRTVKTDFFSGY